MNLRDAFIRTDLTAQARPGRFGVRGWIGLGLGARVRTYSDADILGDYQVVADAPGDVVSQELATGIVTAAVGNPVITKGEGVDVEGIPFPELYYFLGLRIMVPAANVGDVVLGGSSSGLLPSLTLAPGSDLTLKFPALGRETAAATLTHTFAHAGDSVSVEFIGRALLPDPGFIFVFHEDGRQLFHADGRVVQVPASYSN